MESHGTIVECGWEWVHLDIMDGHFVPNLSFGPQMVSDLRKQSKLFFDVHLMLDNPHLYIDPFVKAGANLITIHVEPSYPIRETLQLIRAKNCLCGIALNPGTSKESLLPFLPDVDLVLVMSVQPGFGGQSFKPEALDKLSFLNQQRIEHQYNYRLEVDGGIQLSNAQQCIAAGADTLVIGTSFFQNPKGFVLGHDSGNLSF